MRRVGRAAVAVLVAALVPGFLTPAQAERRPIVNLPPDRIVQLARPATVLVRTKLTGKVSLPSAGGEQALSAFLRADPAAVAAARRQDTKGVLDALLTGIAKDPARFTGPLETE